MATSIRIISDETEIDQLLNRVFTTSVRTGYVEVSNDKICLPIYYRDYEERIKKFLVFEDDVYVTGYPKSGTTWCQEMVWLIMHDLDFEGAKIASSKRYRLLEMEILYDFKKMDIDFLQGKNFFDIVEELERPRCIKTHLNWMLIPEQIRDGSKQPKIIHISRNPKDCCVSQYHHGKLAVGYKGNFEEFCELYLAGRVPYGPYWKCISSYWKQRSRSNILFVTYEEMVVNLPSVIKKVAKFLDKTISDDGIRALEHHLSFESMKNNQALKSRVTNGERAIKYKLNTGGTEFFRKGIVGSYKTEMSPEMDARFSAWISQNISETEFEL